MRHSVTLYRVWLSSLTVPERMGCMMNKLRKLLSALVNPETISYLIFGILTTAINIGLCGLFVQILHWDVVLSNILGWIASVAFAFVTNKLVVFRSKQVGFRLLLRETAAFFAARLVSLGIDTLGMWLWVDVCHGNFWIAKIVMNVIVIVLNYIFSKVFIFKHNK